MFAGLWLAVFGRFTNNSTVAYGIRDGQNTIMKTLEKPFVDLILKVIASSPPVEIDPEKEPEIARLASQLIHDGYLRGEIAPNHRGLPAMIVVFDATIAGRQLCQKIQDDISEASLSTRARKGMKMIFGYILAGIGGMVITLLTQFLLKKLKLE